MEEANVFDFAWARLIIKKLHKDITKIIQRTYILNVGVFSDKKNIDKIKMTT